jgi:hypothetical protein
MSIEEEATVKQLERQQIPVSYGNQGQSRMCLGRYLDKRFLLHIYTHEIRASIVKTQENETHPMTVRNQEYPCALRPILMGYILSRRFHVPFNKEYACWRLSLKKWPTRHVNGMIPKNGKLPKEKEFEAMCIDFQTYVIKNLLSKPKKKEV